MQRAPIGDKYVLCPFQIQMCDQQGGIATGTAFFYDYRGGTFIVTNWHNVTGKDPFTGEHLDPVRTPQFLQAKWPVVNRDYKTAADAKLVHFQAQRIEIEDDNGPLWYEHPTLGSLCDVVAIPSERPADWPATAHIPANKIDETNIPIEPGLKVMVVGFPGSMSTGPGLPLMKTGFLSSMPVYEIRLDAEFSEIRGMKGGTAIPAMFLDVHTVSGMSGSPVFGEYTGFWNPDDLKSNELTANSTFGTGREFFGCHSSRLWKQEERAGLGICFPSSVIDEICQAQHTGSRFPTSNDGFTYT